MSEVLLREIEKYETRFKQRRKEFAADGKITRGEQEKLDRIQKKINRLIDALASQGDVVVVEGRAPVGPSTNPPPATPVDVGGEIAYQGIPLGKLDKQWKKNRARANAQKVRKGIASISGWGQQLDEKLTRHAAQNEALATAENDKEALKQAFLVDAAQGNVEKLRKKAGSERLSERLEGYGKATSKVKQGVTDLEGKALRLAAAQATLQQADVLLKSYEVEKRRDASAAELAEIEGKLAQVHEAIALYKDAAQDPLGTAKKLGLKVATELVDKLLVELLTGGAYERRMKELKAQIAALNQQLDDLRLEGLKAGFEAAARTVEALEKESETVVEQIAQAKTEQRDAVNALARMEGDYPGTTTMFGELQQYYEQVEQAGKNALESSQEYEDAIRGADGALRYTSEVRRIVLQDSSSMRTLYQDDPVNMAVLEHERHARAIIDYTKQVDTWHATRVPDAGKEVEKQNALQQRILENQQFDYVGTMIESAKKQI